MAKKNPQVTLADWLQNGILRLSRVHFLYVAALVVQTVLYDAWKLLTPNIITARWIGAISFLIIITLVWHFAHIANKSANFYRGLVYALVVADIAIATQGVYLGRGMASKAVFLYAIPMVVAAILLSRVALFTTATLSLAAYVGAAMLYFARYFNEGYKIELYGEVGFYAAGFFLLAGLLSTIIHFRDK